jgi:3-hydroxybutyryl-CoA dehydrogenase
MGIGIAHVLAVNGVRTAVVDATPELSAAGHARALQLLERLQSIGVIESDELARGAACLRPEPSIAAATRDADLIFEAVVEQAEVKQNVYAEIEAATADSAVIATNTSSIPIKLLASRLKRPCRFLGVHWFVPPLLVPCVEVIPSPTTDEHVVADVCDALERMRKSPVRVGDGPGFVANRIQFAMFKEAAMVVQEGLATPEQVDEVVRSSFGFRMPFFGPFTIADMAGLDVYADIYDTLRRGLGESFRVPAMLAERVDAGAFGVKTGAGFLDITEDQAVALIERRDRAYHALSLLREQLGA